MKRRQLFLLLPGLGFIAGACLRAPKPGDIAQSDDVEVSGVLSISMSGPELHRIEGEGHVHSVRVNEAARRRLRRAGSVVVRSGPAERDGHSHWVRVRLRAGDDALQARSSDENFQ